MKSALLAALVGAAVLLPISMSAPAAAAPIGTAVQTAIPGDASRLTEEVRHRRWHRGHHRGWNRGWRGRHYGWGHRRCWRSCTGVGPLRICKRKCRY